MEHFPKAISGCRLDRTKFQRLPSILGVQEFKGAVPNTVLCNRKSEIQDGGVKLEIRISQLPDKISTPFQRLTPIFGVQQPNGTLAISARCNWKSVFKDGGRQTGSIYISASRQDITPDPTVNPPPHFGVQQLNGTLANSATCNRKSVF